MRLVGRFLQFLVQLPLHFLVMGLAWLLSPVLPLFAKGDVLPKWLSWFQTPDNTLDGEGQFDHLSEYWRRVKWIQRNPAYGFAWTVLAATVNPEQEFKVWGNIYAKENPFKEGWSFMTTEEGYFSFRYFKKTFEGKCLKFRFGWKLRRLVVEEGVTDTKWKFTFTCNPFKTYTL